MKIELRSKGRFAMLAAFSAMTFCTGMGSAAPQKNKAATKPTVDLVEECSFELQNFRMKHHGEEHGLNITVSYRLKKGIADKDYPDFNPMQQLVRKFLTNYPNETDYWEIVNKKLNFALLSKSTVLTSLTTEIKFPPSWHHPFSHSSRVTRITR